MTHIRLHLAAVLASCALVACGGGDNDLDNAGPYKPTTVVSFADPSIAREGRLTISSLTGSTLATEDFKGNALTVVSAPADLRLVLALKDTANVDGTAVKGRTLSARALGYVSGTTVVLSPLSTMIDAYLAAHPGTTTAVAQAKVLAYFGLPQDFVLNDVTASVSPIKFSNQAFYTQADLAGSVQALATAWVAEIDAGKTRSVVSGAGLLQSGGTELIWEFAETLAGNIDNWAGKKIQGWLLQVSGLSGLLDKLGLGDGPNPIAVQLEKLKAQVDQLIVAVNELPKILDMSTRVTELQKDTDFIAQREKSVITQASESAIPASAFNLPFFTLIDGYGLQDSLQRTQIGVGDSSHGLINLVRQINPKYYSGKEAVAYDKPMLDLYRQSVINQTRALNLTIEALHSQDPIRARASEEASDKYYINLKRQKQSYPNGLNPFQDGSVLDRQTGLLWKASIYDYKGYEHLAGSLAGGKWRLPTIGEVRGVMPRSDSMGRLPANLRSLSVPAAMRHFGFEPICENDVCRDFADLGPAGPPLKILGPGYVATSETYRDVERGDLTSYYYLRAWVVDLANNGRQEDPSVKWCQAGRAQGYKEQCFESKRLTEIKPWFFPIWLTRAPATPVAVHVQFDQGFDALTGRSQARAVLEDSDGRYTDMTKDVIWSVVGDADEVHISNAPSTSGQVQYRGHAAPNPPKAFAVRAEYPWYLTDRLQGTLISPDAPNTVVYGNEGVAAPTLASLLISPGQTETSSYLARTGSETTGSFRLNLRAVGMLNTGLAQNQDPATITWTLTADRNLPRALRVDNGVLVIPEPSNVSSGSRRTLVQITGTKGAATGKAYLVLN